MGYTSEEGEHTMNPLFRVGEKVRLVSKSHPEYNGEYFVEGVVDKDEIFIDRLSGERCVSTAMGYLLDEPLQDNDVNYPRECKWAESALRKIYPPSTESFDEMMQNIKQGKKVDNLVEEFI